MGEGRTEPTGRDQSSDQPTTRRRVTVREAADVLGISVEAVRGRIKRGTMGHYKEANGKVYVWLEVEPHRDQTSTSFQPDGDQTQPDPTSERPDNDQTVDQSRLVEVLEGQVEDLRTRLDREQEANRENRRIIAGLLPRIPELTAPDQGPHDPESVVETSGDAEPRSDTVGAQEGAQEPGGEEGTARRPWWLRWLGG